MGLIESVKGMFTSKGKTTVETQTRTSYSHPFNAINKYIPLKAELKLYKVMREAIPILDTAIYKIDRLKGDFKVIVKENEKIQGEINEFLSNVQVNAKERGFFTFLNNYFMTTLEGGFSFGEIVVNNSKDDIYALKNIESSRMKLRQTENPLEILICEQRHGNIEPVVLPYQNLLLYTALNPEGDNPYGVSLFRSMPFVTGLLLKILNSIGINWDRFGNVRYSVTYKPDKDNLTGEKAMERAKDIQTQFSNAITEGKTGTVKDFFGVGDIEVKVIGADNQILDCEVPVKIILEQLVAKTGLPPFLLGLSWSTTERMSSQQADLLTSELEAYRRLLEAPSRQVIDLWLQLKGYRCNYELEWNDINLQDEVEMAKAELYRRQAEEKKINNVIKKRNQNFINQDVAAEELGYEKPAGEAPTTQQQPQTQEQKHLSKVKDFKQWYHKSLDNKNKEFFDIPNDDPRIQEVEKGFTDAIMDSIKALEKEIIKLIPQEKAYKKELNPEIEEGVKGAIAGWLARMIGSKESDSEIDREGIYNMHMLRSFAFGINEGNRIAKEEHPDIAPAVNRLIPSYSNPYLSELVNNGMELVKTKAKYMQDTVLYIMGTHAANGDNPEVWARSLHNELGGKRWYWERLARSESAMAIDRAMLAEYEAEEFPYVEWSCAVDACPICQALNGLMWAISNAPRVVEDTHPNCRCRKVPKTRRQYEEWLGANRQAA